MNGKLTLSRYLFISRISARQQWIYRGEMATRAISTVLFLGVFVALWTAAYGLNQQEEMVGYTLPQMLWYLAMTETVALSTSRIFMDISAAVKAGDLAYTLLRPTSYPLNQVAHSLGDSAPRFIMNLLTAGVVVAIGAGGFSGSWRGFAAFLLMGVLALVLDALIAVLIGLTAFWLEEVMPVFLIYQKLLFTIGGLFLPLEMFPAWLQRIAEWLPFRFITNAPARIFVHFNAKLFAASVTGQVVYILVVGGVLCAVWKAAQRRLVVHGG
jgi:ABC-2 type transport system permease protein